jgi:hypothetical protein
LANEEKPYCLVYRLQRIDDGRAIAIATFYSPIEALTVIHHPSDGYRLMLEDRMVWPSSGRHNVKAI